MTPLSSTALEAAERAVKTCLASKEVSGYLNAPNMIATAAITAYLAQREKEGWVMVPVEPTLVMMEAAGKAVATYIEKMTASGGAIEASDYALRAVIHRAMISELG